DVSKADYEQALEHIEWSLDRNRRNGKAWVLKAAILRKTERWEDALAVCTEAQTRDVFNLSSYFEQYKLYQLLGKTEEEKQAREQIVKLSRGYVNSFMEYGLDYAAAGLFTEAIELLGFTVGGIPEETHPMIYYYLGWCCLQSDQHTAATSWFKKGAAAHADLCFP